MRLRCWHALSLRCRYAHYTQVEPNEKEAAYWLKAASDSRIAQSAPGGNTVRTGMRPYSRNGMTHGSSSVDIAPATEPSYTEQSKVHYNIYGH